MHRVSQWLLERVVKRTGLATEFSLVYPLLPNRAANMVLACLMRMQHSLGLLQKYLIFEYYE